MMVSVGNRDVDVVVVYKNNKNVYFRFKEDGKLYVYCSKSVSLRKIKKMIKENESAILKMIMRIEQKIVSSQFFHYLGNAYEVVLSDIDGVLFDEGFVFVRNKEELEKFYVSECLRVFYERVRVIKEGIDVGNFDVRIRKMKTRWGVCNTKHRVITLNSELLKREVDLLDYVIVHEMCHFFEGNHSSRFWSHVEKYYPNYKLARKRLKEVV